MTTLPSHGADGWVHTVFENSRGAIIGWRGGMAARVISNSASRDGSVSASIDNKPAEPEIVVTHLMEGIGIALDIPNDRMFVTDFAGSIYSARLDGSGEKNFLFAQGNLTGIAYAEV